MYVKTSVRKTKTGEVRYLQLAHNEWDADKGRSVPKVIYGFGREDQLDKDAVRRLVASLSRLLEPGERAADRGRRAWSSPSRGPTAAPTCWTSCGSGSGSGRSWPGSPRRAGPAAGRGSGGAGAVRAGRQPGAGPVVEAGGVGVDEPRRAHRRPRRGQRRRLLPGDGLAARRARRAGEAGVLPGRGPSQPSGRSAVLRHDLHLFRDRRGRRGGRAGLARGEIRRPGRRGRGPGRRRRR